MKIRNDWQMVQFKKTNYSCYSEDKSSTYVFLDNINKNEKTTWHVNEKSKMESRLPLLQKNKYESINFYFVIYIKDKILFHHIYRTYNTDPLLFSALSGTIVSGHLWQISFLAPGNSTNIIVVKKPVRTGVYTNRNEDNNHIIGLFTTKRPRKDNDWTNREIAAANY